MISIRLRNIFLLSIPLFVVHGIEEYLTGFYKVDDILFGHLTESVAQPAFIIFQVIWWFLLLIIANQINQKWAFKALIIVGITYMLEVHHLIHALIAKGYYPGATTALLFPFIAFFFWKEIIKRSTD